jgi:beta-glucosidase-like glycosyl hydrolase
LKNNLGQKILIISDDLDQNSLINKFPLKEIFKLPIESGTDILIFSGYRLPVEQGLNEFLTAVINGEISNEAILKSQRKVFLILGH